MTDEEVKIEANETENSEGDGGSEIIEKHELIGIEALARKMGWKSEEDWKGDPPEGGLMAPEDYLTHRFSQNDRVARELRRENAEFKRALEGFNDLQERAYQRALKDIEARQAKAVEEGDSDAYNATIQQRQALEEDRKAAQPQQTEHPDFRAWAADNEWYNDDLEKTLYADQIAPVLMRKHGLEAGRALYDKVTEAVKAKFPDQNTQRRRQASPVEGGGRKPNGGGGHTWSDLPAEDKAIGERLIRLNTPVPQSDGTTKPMTRDDFLKQYPWDS